MGCRPVVIEQDVVRYILKGELVGFANGLSVGCEKRVKDDSRFLV